MLIWFCLLTCCYGSVWYVSDVPVGSGNGSFSKPFGSLQEAFTNQQFLSDDVIMLLSDLQSYSSFLTVNTNISATISSYNNNQFSLNCLSQNFTAISWQGNHGQFNFFNVRIANCSQALFSRGSMVAITNCTFIHNVCPSICVEWIAVFPLHTWLLT